MPISYKIHLPFMREREVFNMFFLDVFVMNGSVKSFFSISYFLVIWKALSKHMRVRSSMRSSLCAIWEQFWLPFETCGRLCVDSSPRLSQKQKYIEMISCERQLFQSRKQHALQNSINFDDADHSLFGLPHFTSNRNTSKIMFES